MAPSDTIIDAQSVQSAHASEKQAGSPPKEKGDIALGLANELDAGYELSPALECRVLRKIDFILLPLISCTAVLSFLDKVSNNFANNYGLSVALGMRGDQFSWSASIFYFAFLVWQPAVSYMTQHFPLGKVVAVNCVGWGLMVLGQGFVKNYAGFLVLRFFQGLFEACVLPTFQMMCSIWWTREEQSLRTAFWFNSLSGVLSGLFAYAIGQWHVQPGFKLYQYLYITYGSFTCGWGIMLFFALPDSPVTAWFLNHEERLAAVARVSRNQTGMINREFKREQAIEALLDFKTWYYVFFAFVSNIVNGGLNAFSTVLIKGFGFSALDTTLLSMPHGFISTAVNIVIGLFISYTLNKRLFYMSAIILIPIAGTAIQFALFGGARGPRLLGYYLTGAYNSPYVMLLALIASNTAGTTKKVVVSGMVWVSYCVGNIVGPFFFRDEDKPLYRMGVGMMLGSFALQAFLSLGFRGYLMWLNKQKDREADAVRDQEEDNAAHAFADLTDKQIDDFEDDDEWAEDDSADGFLTDEEYDILDASDEEYLEDQQKKLLKK